MATPQGTDAIAIARARARARERETTRGPSSAERTRVAAGLPSEKSLADPERRRSLLDNAGAAAQTFSDAQTFGVGGILSDALSSIGKGTFREARDFRAANKAALPTSVALAAGLAGGLASPVSTFFGPARQGAGMLKTIGKGVVEGGAQGAASGLGEHIGTTDGAADNVGIGALVGGVLGGTASGVVRGLTRRGAQGAAEASAARRGDAAKRADAELTYEVPVIPPGTGGPDVLPIDVAGPTVRAHARGAARSTPGRSVLERVFGERDAKMPSAITGDVEDAALKTRQLREQNRVLGNKEFAEAREATKGVPVESEALRTFMESPMGRSAWMEVQTSRANRLGTGAQDVALPVSQRPVELEPMAPVPIRGEKGRLRKSFTGVSTESLENESNRIAQELGEAEAKVSFTDDERWSQYLELPSKEQTGKTARRVDQHGNKLKRQQEDLPTGDDLFDPDELDEMRSTLRQYGKTKAIRMAKAKAKERIDAEIERRATGFLVDDLGREMPTATVDETVPDAEAIHQMKRILRRRAAMEAGQSPATGAKAISAQDALGLLDVARRELPEPYQAADRAYSGRMGDIDALVRGRRPVLENPDAAKRTPSLSDTEADVGAMSPERQSLFRVGKTFDLASRVRGGKLTPQKAVDALRDPTSPLSREVALSGSPLGGRLQGWGAVKNLQDNLLSGSGEVLEPETRRFAAQLTDVAAPSPLWTVIRGLRRLVGKGAEATKRSMDAEDKAFLQMLTRPGALEQAIALMQSVNSSKTAAGARAAGVAGRTVGGGR